MKKSILLVLIVFSSVMASQDQSGGVQPLDQSIPLFAQLDARLSGVNNNNQYGSPMTGGWIESGKLFFKIPKNPSIGISDVGFSKWRNAALALSGVDNFGISTSDLDGINKIKGEYSGLNEALASNEILKTGYYDPNWDTIVASIQKGDFENLNYWRLVLSEYLLGRVAIAVSPLVGAPWLSNTYSGLPSDQQILNDFVTKSGMYLKQTRYARNAFTSYQISNNSSATPAAPSGWGQINNSSTTLSNQDYIHYLKPVDTFAGLILVNQTSGNSAFTIGDQTNQVQPGTVGFYPASGSADKWDSAPVDSQLWGKKRAVSFSVEGMAGQGQVQLYENQNQLPQIFIQGPSGAPVKINFDDTTLQTFFKYSHPWAIVVKSTPANALQIIGLAKLNTVSFPNALRFVGASADATTNSVFSLGDLWNMPMKLYKQTISSVNTNAGQPYPLASWVLQGIFNGYLQTSFYTSLVYQSFSTQWVHLWNGPSFHDWVNPTNNSLDWKILRSLIVTYAANKFIGINDRSLAYIEQILSAPRVSINNIFYVGATDQYVPVVSVKL